MTLPANDAFSFGLTGSHDPTRPTYTISLRSTSPKIPFVSNRARSPPPHTGSRRSLRSPRSMSNGTSDGYGRRDQHGRRSHDSTNGRVGGVPHVRRTSKIKISHQTKPPPSHIDWEIPRKTLHSSIGFLTSYLYVSHDSLRHVVIAALTMALCVIVPADVLRLNHAGFERLYEKFLGFLMRDSEKKSMNGVIWYILGVLWVLAFYPLDVAVVSILILSWTDTAASTIGRLWGRYTPRLPARLPILGLPFAPRKSLAGFVAGSVTGALIIVGFWGWLGPLGSVALTWSWEGGVNGTNMLAGWLGLSVIGVVGGLIAGVSEALDVGSLDDNLTLPIISGGCLLGFFKLIQWCFT